MTLIHFFPFVLNIFLLHSRRRPWARSAVRWYGVGFLFLAGCITLFYSADPHLAAYRLLGWHLLTPLIFSLADYGISWLSLRLQGRDIYLYMRGSKDIKPWSLTGGSHVSMFDRLFSLLLICLVVGMLYLGQIWFA
jgi:hypothetical protein